MRFVHLADLHLGKRVNEFSMTEDQRFILKQITEIIKAEKPDAVLIAGDVYDKPLPPAEAVQLFDDFISALAAMDTEVMVISGNHDSAERLSFGSRIMDRSGVHFAGGYDGSVRKVTLEDGYGKVNFYMLPFVKPVHVKNAFSDDEKACDISSFNDALSFAIEKMDIDRSERNVLIAHQFVTGSERCDSEEISVGGLDNVDADVFDVFDYTALGHLHGPQNINSRIRYAGSPLKYSFSEAAHTKTLTITELGEKGKEPVIETIKLVPARDMKEIRGDFDELTDKNYYKDLNKEDYFRVILTDEEDVIGALQSLRAIYPNIMRLEYDNERTRASFIPPAADKADAKSPLEVFENLYEAQNGKGMDDNQRELIAELIEKVWGERR